MEKIKAEKPLSQAEKEEAKEIKLAYKHGVTEAVPLMQRAGTSWQMKEIRLTCEKGFFKIVRSMLKHCGDAQQMKEMRLACENGVPEALEVMNSVSEFGNKREIRLAYENGVPEAVPDMLKVPTLFSGVNTMKEIRLAYEENIVEAVELMQSVKCQEKMKAVREASIILKRQGMKIKELHNDVNVINYKD